MSIEECADRIKDLVLSLIKCIIISHDFIKNKVFINNSLFVVIIDIWSYCFVHKNSKLRFMSHIEIVKDPAE